MGLVIMQLYAQFNFKNKFYGAFWRCLKLNTFILILVDLQISIQDYDSYLFQWYFKPSLS